VAVIECQWHQVKQLTAQQAIADLDRQWQMEREGFYIHGENGSRQLPSEGAAWIGGIIAAGFGVFWTMGTISAGAPGVFPVLGLLFIAFGIFGAIFGHQRASDYKAAEASYQRKRKLFRKGSSSRGSSKISRSNRKKKAKPLGFAFFLFLDRWCVPHHRQAHIICSTLITGFANQTPITSQQGGNAIWSIRISPP
jgi:hypothetical protein